LRNNQRPATQVARQKTLKTEISCVGTGLHSGSKTRMTLRPAEAGTGIVFRRTDIAGSGAIPANWANVVDTRLCSRLANAEGASVATVEHLMSALAGLQVDNCTIEIDGPEVPAMDGSASPFVFLLDCAGIEEQSAPRRAIEVLEPVSVGGDGKQVVLEPASGFRLSCMIDFPSAAIARQSIEFALDAAAFREEVSRARTFGFAREVEQLRAARSSPLERGVREGESPVGVVFAAPRVAFPESGCLGMQPKSGGKSHLRLNTGERPIAIEYREGKMKRTLKRESKSA